MEKIDCEKQSKRLKLSVNELAKQYSMMVNSGMIKDTKQVRLYCKVMGVLMELKNKII